MNRTRRTMPDAAEFPANPFVALSDFMMVVLLIVVLGFVYQAVSSNRLFERLAVTNLQNQLQKDVNGGANCQTDSCRKLYTAFQTGAAKQSFVDGDLQRFWIDGKTLYAPVTLGAKPHYELTENGKQILAGFGEILRARQGDTNKPGTGLFKRIQVQGNADRSEGDDNAVWIISLNRAREAAQVLQNRGGIYPKLIEPTGRGCWDERTSGAGRAEQNRRLEIVVIYSATRATQYEQENRSNPVQ